MSALAVLTLLAASTARIAEPVPTEETLLRCTVWSAGQLAQADSEEGRRTYSMLMAWFVGRYEGKTGRFINDALGPREVERYAAQGGELNNVCMPLAIAFSARLEMLAKSNVTAP